MEDIFVDLSEVDVHLVCPKDAGITPSEQQASPPALPVARKKMKKESDTDITGGGGGENMSV